MVVCRGDAAPRTRDAVTPDVAEIVARLRAMAGPTKPNLLDEAADLLERLDRERTARETPQPQVVSG